MHSTYSIYICSDNYLEDYLQYLREIVENTYYFCIFVKKQGSNLFSSNGRVKIFSSESRIFFVKKQPHPPHMPAATQRKPHPERGRPEKNCDTTSTPKNIYYCPPQGKKKKKCHQNVENFGDKKENVFVLPNLPFLFFSKFLSSSV